MVPFSLANIFSSTYDLNIICKILFHSFWVIAFLLFVRNYSKVVPTILKKRFDLLSIEEYFRLTISSLLLCYLAFAFIVPSIMGYFISPTTSIIFRNFAVCIIVPFSVVIYNGNARIKLDLTEQALDLKQSFIRYISHEMRTPINIASVGLLMHEKYLQENGFLDDDSSELLGDIKSAVVIALDTLNDVLNYEKLYSNLMVLERTIEKPIEFILSAIRIFQVTAQNNGVNLILPTETDGAQLEFLKDKRFSVDVCKMGQVLRNFISNALKFTPRDGSITVSVHCGSLAQLHGLNDTVVDVDASHHNSMFHRVVEPWIEIAVQDTGIGIAKENLHRVFNEIVQFNPNATQNGNGSGMGMYISKGIVELHGGKVTLHSEGKFKGCRFSVLLPLIQVEPEEEQKIIPPVEFSAVTSEDEFSYSRAQDSLRYDLAEKAQKWTTQETSLTSVSTKTKTQSQFFGEEPFWAMGISETSVPLEERALKEDDSDELQSLFDQRSISVVDYGNPLQQQGETMLMSKSTTDIEPISPILQRLRRVGSNKLASFSGDEGAATQEDNFADISGPPTTTRRPSGRVRNVDGGVADNDYQFSNVIKEFPLQQSQNAYAADTYVNRRAAVHRQSSVTSSSMGNVTTDVALRVAQFGAVQAPRRGTFSDPVDTTSTHTKPKDASGRGGVQNSDRLVDGEALLLRTENNSNIDEQQKIKVQLHSPMRGQTVDSNVNSSNGHGSSTSSDERRKHGSKKSFILADGKIGFERLLSANSAQVVPYALDLGEKPYLQEENFVSKDVPYQGDSFFSMYSSHHSEHPTDLDDRFSPAPIRKKTERRDSRTSIGTGTSSLKGSPSNKSETRWDTLTGKRILMVDDSAISLKLCVKLFRKLGAEVDDALDGSVALAKVQESILEAPLPKENSSHHHHYDFIVMDNLMPIMNGTEACRKMRQAGYQGIIIGLTGNALQEDVEEYLQHGANAVLRKPLDLEEFHSTLEIIKRSQT